jgi:hypothetical protein
MTTLTGLIDAKALATTIKALDYRLRSIGCGLSAAVLASDGKRPSVPEDLA